MFAEKNTKSALMIALIAATAWGLVLISPARSQGDQDEAPPPPPPAEEDNDELQSDWPPPAPSASQPGARARGRRAGRLDDQRPGQRGESDRRGPGSQRQWGPRGQGPGGQMRPGEGPPGARGPMGPHGMRQDQGPGAMISEEEFERAMQVLKDINPEAAERLEQLWERSPQRAQGMLHRFGPRIYELLRLKESDPELYKWSVKDMKIGLACDKLARQYREATKAGDKDRIKEIRTQIADQVEEHFEVRQKMGEVKLERLERRLAEARKRLEKRAATRGDLIEKRIGELTGDQPKPTW